MRFGGFRTPGGGKGGGEISSLKADRSRPAALRLLTSFFLRIITPLYNSTLPKSIRVRRRKGGVQSSEGSVVADHLC
jgi:hypothetical protein